MLILKSLPITEFGFNCNTFCFWYIKHSFTSSIWQRFRYPFKYVGQRNPKFIWWIRPSINSCIVPWSWQRRKNGEKTDAFITFQQFKVMTSYNVVLNGFLLVNDKQWRCVLQVLSLDRTNRKSSHVDKEEFTFYP